jgi:hypothetical protein
MARRLTPEEREAIREVRRNNPRMTLGAIAARFGVSEGCICQILSGRIYSSEYKAIPASKQKPKPTIRPNVMPGISMARLTAGRA